jgi:hypothetical protein
MGGAAMRRPLWISSRADNGGSAGPFATTAPRDRVPVAAKSEYRGTQRSSAAAAATPITPIAAMPAARLTQRSR